MKMNRELAPEITKYIEGRRSEPGKARGRGAHRIDLAHVEHLTFQGIAKEGGNFTVTIDEPANRGGHGRGPRPSSYFLLGIGSCLLTQWAKLAVIENLNIDGLNAIIRGHTEAGIDGYYTDFVFDITMSGGESEERIRQVAEESERLCFIHNTLKRAVPCTTNVSYNGKVVYTKTVGPTLLLALTPNSSNP